MRREVSSLHVQKRSGEDSRPDTCTRISFISDAFHMWFRKRPWLMVKSNQRRPHQKVERKNALLYERRRRGVDRGEGGEAAQIRGAGFNLTNHITSHLLLSAIPWRSHTWVNISSEPYTLISACWVAEDAAAFAFDQKKRPLPKLFRAFRCFW